MKFYEPQLLIVKNTKGEFCLHSTTFFDKINVKPQGAKVATKISKSGALKVELYAVKDASISGDENIKCINPVVHHVNLGKSISEDINGNLSSSVKVSVYFIDNSKSKSRSSGRRRTGSGVVRSTSSTRGSRPNSGK